MARYVRETSAPSSGDHISTAKVATGISCRRKVSSVAIPKLPPPPCRAQNSSGFSSSEARTVSPAAVTSSAESRLSAAIPNLRSSQQEPPPRVSPATPVVETRPPGATSPCGWQARSKSPQSAPPCAVAVRASGSTVTWFSFRRSIVTPPSVRQAPATLWPPPRIATSISRSRAKPSTAAMSAALSTWAIAPGRFSIIELKIVRASS